MLEYAPMLHVLYYTRVWLHDGKFSLVEGFTATCSHNLPIYNKWLGPALGSKVKSHYIIEHNVSIIQLLLKAS